MGQVSQGAGKVGLYLVSSGKSLKDGRISCGNPVLPNGTKD